MLFWLGLYLSGLVAIFTVGDFILQGLNRYFYLNDQEDYYYQLPITPFWQQYWLDLLALGNLQENWSITIALLCWPISLITIGVIGLFELRKSLVNYFRKLPETTVAPPRPIG